MQRGARADGTGLNAIRALEERSFNAWPALQTVLAGGWVLRFADGYTKRANSVNALLPALAVEDIAAFAAPLYAAKGLPLIFRLSPLAGATDDQQLAALGYVRIDETIVMTAPIPILACADAAVHIAGRPVEAWTSGFARANDVPPPRQSIHDRMLASIQPSAAFAALKGADDLDFAWGLAVTERGMTGLFDIVTRPALRRHGGARRLVGSLLDWGRRQGAETAYLQILASNAPAIALYSSFGFGEIYRYHYRIRPDAIRGHTYRPTA